MIIIDDGHPKVRRITLGAKDNGILTSRVLERGGAYTGIVVGIVQQSCGSWAEVKAFLEAMGVDHAPELAPQSDLQIDAVRH